MSTLNVNNINEAGGVDAVIASGVLDSGSLPAGSIVNMQSVIKTDTFTASLAAGASSAVTDLSITYTLSNSANKLLIMGYFGAAANSIGYGRTGIACADDGTLLGIGDAAGSRARAAAGGYVSANDNASVVAMPAVHILHSPGDTASHTYTLHAINVTSTTQTVYINRFENDADNGDRVRTSSALTIMEVAG